VNYFIVSRVVAFFALANLALVVYIVLRRALQHPSDPKKNARRAEYGDALDEMLASGEPPSDPTEVLSFHQRWEADELQSAILDRADLLRGSSLEVLTGVFARSGLFEARVKDLGSRRVWDRRLAADALGRSGSQDAVRHLALSLRDDDDDVRSIAAKGLGKLRAVSAIGYLVSLFRDIADRSCVSVADTLIGLGEDAVPALLDAAGDPGSSERTLYWVLRCLESIGDPAGTIRAAHEAGPHIAPAMTHESERVRAAAASALGRLGAVSDAQLLRVAFGDPAPEVRRQAAAAAGRVAGVEAVPWLLELFGDPDFDVSYSASRALLSFGDGAVDAAQSLAGTAQGAAYERALEVLDAAGRTVAL